MTLGLETLETECAEILEAEAAMYPILADAIEAAAQIIDRDLEPFARQGWRAILRIRYEPRRVVGLQVEVAQTILAIRAGHDWLAPGRVWVTSQRNCEDQCRVPIVTVKPEADAIAAAFRNAHRDTIQDIFVRLMLSDDRLSNS
jgi:hypothetical protein